MKKVLLVLLAMAAPLFASVTFTFTDNTDGTGTLSYTATAGDEPVGMGLVVDCTSGQIDAIASISSFFDIFLDFAHDDGSYTYGEGSSNPNNAAALVGGPGVATLPNANFVISIGGLGGAVAPLTPAPSSGSIVLVGPAGSGVVAAGTITADTLRGGVVDKAGTVATVGFPLAFTITRPDEGCETCIGDVDDSNYVDFDDYVAIISLLNSVDWYVDKGQPGYKACADIDSSDYVDFDDYVAIISLLNANDWYFDCP